METFERSCEIGLWRLTANRISEIFGVRLNKRLNGKLATVLEQIEHRPPRLPRLLEACLSQAIRKVLGYLRNDGFAGFPAQCLNVHVDFPLLQRIALPVIIHRAVLTTFQG